MPESCLIRAGLALTPTQREELQRRLAAADRGEMTYASWQDVKRRLLQPK